MSMRIFRFAVPLLSCLGACAPSPGDSTVEVDTIFMGDHIITMDDTTAAAVAVAGNRILATGSREEILRLQSGSTQVIELGEHALLPGFIDAHGHVSGVGMVTALLDLSPPPVGEVQTIDDIVAVIRQHIATENPAPGTWIYGPRIR